MPAARVKCKTCDGSGNLNKFYPWRRKCSDCSGTGMKNIWIDTITPVTLAVPPIKHIYATSAAYLISSSFYTTCPPMWSTEPYKPPEPKQPESSPNVDFLMKKVGARKVRLDFSSDDKPSEPKQKDKSSGEDGSGGSNTGSK